MDQAPVNRYAGQVVCRDCGRTYATRFQVQHDTSQIHRNALQRRELQRQRAVQVTAEAEAELRKHEPLL